MGQPLAGILLASILAFLAVGLFDSLIDVPRIGTLFYLVLLFAIYLTTIFGKSKFQHVKERSL
jgi:hypothetical protein